MRTRQVQHIMKFNDTYRIHPSHDVRLCVQLKNNRIEKIKVRRDTMVITTDAHLQKMNNEKKE